MAEKKFKLDVEIDTSGIMNEISDDVARGFSASMVLAKDLSNQMAPYMHGDLTTNVSETLKADGQGWEAEIIWTEIYARRQWWEHKIHYRWTEKVMQVNRKEIEAAFFNEMR